MLCYVYSILNLASNTLSFFTGITPQSTVSQYLNLLTGQKSAFLPHRRLVAPIHVKLGTTEGHMGPLGHAKFHASRCPGWKRSPRNGKNFHFLAKACPTGANPWFFTPNYPALLFHIWHDTLHRLWSYCWETVHWSFSPKFSMHPVEKTMCWIEKWLAPF